MDADQVALAAVLYNLDPELVSKPREWPNEDFTINLVGGLKCKLFGTARNLDASYISIEVVTGAVPGFPASAKPPQRLWKRQCERIAAGRRT